jgi:hypothetical protein
MCHCILSYSKASAEKFLRGIKETLEKELMWRTFPDILYADPHVESSSWSLQNGIRVRRSSVSRPQQTVEAFGLMEGMPTGGHWDRLVFDDTETEDISRSADQISTLKKSFDMAQSLGMPNGTIVRVIGTFYTHCGLLTFLRDMKYGDGKEVYTFRKIPATDDGTKEGKPVFMDEREWRKIKLLSSCDSQYLCNPIPAEEIVLDSKLLQPIEPEFIWKDRFKFMVIDQAGGKDTNKTGGRDLWSFGIVSIFPSVLNSEAHKLSNDDLGISDVCLEDLIADHMTVSEAIDTAVRMYLKSGLIYQLGVEKVALSTTEIHIAEALAKKGRRISVDAGNLVLLRPGNRSTEQRVESALSWPLNNGKLFYSTAIAPRYRDKLIEEMDNFPVFHADILNMWAYAYDMFKEFKFSMFRRPKVKTVSQIMAKVGTKSDF